METEKLTQEILRTQWLELSKSSMEITNVGSGTTICSASRLSSRLMIDYRTLFRNRPNTYGNYIAVWQQPDSLIPWDDEPLIVKTINGDTPEGSMLVSELALTKHSYVLGYAVGPQLFAGSRQEYGNICTTTFISSLDNGLLKINQMTPSISILASRSDSVAINYMLPTNIKPKTNGAWIGLWESSVASYKNPPMASNNISEDVSSGFAFIDQLELPVDRTYVIALFMSGWGGDNNSKHDQKAMACYITFEM